MCVCLCICVPQCALNNNLQKLVLLLYHLVELRSGLAWWQASLPTGPEDSVETYPHCVAMHSRHLRTHDHTLGMLSRRWHILKGRVERAERHKEPTKKGRQFNQGLKLRNGAYSRVERIMGIIREATVSGTRLGRKTLAKGHDNGHG